MHTYHYNKNDGYDFRLCTGDVIGFFIMIEWYSCTGKKIVHYYDLWV